MQKSPDCLVRQREDTKSKKDACSARIENYDSLLSRLRKTKEEISDLKANFKQIKKKDKNLRKEKFDWKGYTYDNFKEKMENVEDANEKYFKNSLDHVLDSLNNEITRIQNERSYEKGLLGRLEATLNSLRNRIRNFWN